MTDRDSTRLLAIVAALIVLGLALGLTAAATGWQPWAVATLPAAAPVATCTTDAACAVADWRAGMVPRPDTTQAPESMCPAGWTVRGIDSDDVPAYCVPALIST